MVGRQTIPVDRQPGNIKTGDRKTGNIKTSDRKTGCRKTGSRKTGRRKIGRRKQCWGSGSACFWATRTHSPRYGSRYGFGPGSFSFLKKVLNRLNNACKIKF